MSIGLEWASCFENVQSKNTLQTIDRYSKGDLDRLMFLLKSKNDWFSMVTERFHSLTSNIHRIPIHWSLERIMT